MKKKVFREKYYQKSQLPEKPVEVVVKPKKKTTKKKGE